MKYIFITGGVVSGLGKGICAVSTSDFMTANYIKLPYSIIDEASTRIVNEVKGINRVMYDVTSKPPATIEYE